MRKTEFITILLALPILVSAQAIDSAIRLNSKDGSTAFAVQDSAAINKFRVDSAGNVLMVGTCTIQGNRLSFPARGTIETSSMTIQLLVAGQEVVVNRSDGLACFVIKDDWNFYPRVWERRIYDDAGNFLLGITTNIYVTGHVICATAANEFRNNSDAIVRVDANADEADAVFRVKEGGGADRFTVTEAGRVWSFEDIQVGGNDILDSGGTSRISLGDLSTYASTVTVRGLTVQGALTIGQGRLSDSSVVSADILDGTIVSADIADGTIASADIADGTIVSADIADGTIASADIGDRQVSSRKLLISGATVFASATISHPGSTDWNWVDMSDMSITFSIDALPAFVFANFSCQTDNNGSSLDDANGFRLVIDGITVSEVISECGTGHLTPVALTGGARITGTPPKSVTVKVQWAEEWGGTIGYAGNRSLSAFWVGTP